MNIVFYLFLTMAAIYVIFHIGNVFVWWYEKIQVVVKGIWNLILKLFGKG